MSRTGAQRSPRPAVATLLLLVAAHPARGAQSVVSCTTPDVLCTGDPCTIAPGRALTSPCALDFGSRALVIAGRLRVPDGGTLQLTAGSINVKSIIYARGVRGGNVTLIASGDITQRARVDASGTAICGTITLQAGGNVALNGKMKSAGPLGSNAAGGTILVRAGGTIFGPGQFGDDVRGASTAPAGYASYHGGGDVSLVGHLHIWGASGGYAEFISDAGKVDIGTDIRTRVRTGAGGTAILTAATDAIVARGIIEDGATDGGTLIVTGATVTLPLHEGLHAHGTQGKGGTVIVSGGIINVDEDLTADGFTTGGSVTVTGDVVNINANVLANGNSGGGQIALTATTGDLTQTGLVNAGGGGRITAEATGGNLSLRGKYRAAPGGCIALSAGGTVSTTGATFDLPVSGSCP